MSMAERLKQIAIGAAGSILTLILIAIWGWISGGGLIYFLGGVTQSDLAATKTDLAATQGDLATTQSDLAATRADLATTQDGLVSQEWQASEPIALRRATSWGDWQGESACPINHYVCSLELLSEPRQGGDADDTAVNGLRMRCCPLPGVSLVEGTEQ